MRMKSHLSEQIDISCCTLYDKENRDLRRIRIYASKPLDYQGLFHEEHKR